ncbi:mtcA2 [Symbiodinium pilosum]|uniref:carbonic anhydrase n=1 Tax=Symbiodinium pilosum TaxID=2952 RepID=A0A812WKT1_SYMPI|nr:mtcA2 [Symbiodinium pilosum]
MSETCCAAFLRRVENGRRTRIRTAADGPLNPGEALQRLRDGNERFATGRAKHVPTSAAMRQDLFDQGQSPHSAIIGCADSRAPLETIFDAMPGDIFALRNAGNTCTHAEGSMVGSLEFCSGMLGTRLIFVLGHTKCGAVYGATQAYFNSLKAKSTGVSSALEGLLQDLASVAEQAAADMGANTDPEDVACHAVRVNVFHTINFLLKYSHIIRERVLNEQLEIQGGIYNLSTGRVEFLGRSPDQSELLTSKVALPPSVTGVNHLAARGSHGVRTAADGTVCAKDALRLLAEGNERFAVGTPLARSATASMREALVNHGQAPHTAVMGCADSRAPLETIFDAMPGDLFVLRNAGNTCTHAEGSMVGSLEFCASKLGSKLILVLGHTQCGALAGAVHTHLSQKDKARTGKPPNSALAGLLQELSGVAQQVEESLGPQADTKIFVDHAIKVNVFHSIDFLLRFSQPLRELVKTGGLEIHGGIYHLESGRVEFLGPSPKQAALLASDISLPPSMASLPIRTALDGPTKPETALQLLREGNQRFAVGAPISGKLSSQMRKALVKDGQAPHSAIIGCADSRAPLETVFDAMPGDIFVLRNAGNTCTHAEGSIMGSLEFSIGALNTQLILVLGHTSCGAILGAAKAFLQSKTAVKTKVNKALDALLDGLSVVISQAAEELGSNANEDNIVSHAVKLNVFHTIEFLLQKSDLVRQKIADGELEIQGGIYDLESGRVEFLGRHPLHATFMAEISGDDRELGA